jgi:type VI protein secretion system component Hcp
MHADAEATHMSYRPVHRLSIATAIAALVVTGGAAAAQTRAAAEPQGFLQIPEIPGSSSAPPYKGWIEVTSLAHPAATRTRVSPHDFHFTKFLDKASVSLREAFKRGTRFQTIRVAAREQGDQPHLYLKYTLQNARISSYRVDGQLEHITLTYEKIDRSRTPEPVAGPTR